MLIGIAGWVLLGLLAGFIATKFVNLRGDEPGLGIAIAGVGGVIGGWLYTAISGAGVSYFNVWSLFFAALGGTVVAVGWHVSRRFSANRDAARRPW